MSKRTGIGVLLLLVITLLLLAAVPPQPAPPVGPFTPTAVSEVYYLYLPVIQSVELTPTPVPTLVPMPTVPSWTGYTCDNCIKGNISGTGEKIYHFPGCPNYGSCKIDLAKGERWFSTEAEAQTAGWRKAANCPY